MENGAGGASSGQSHETVLRLPLVMPGSRQAVPSPRSQGFCLLLGTGSPSPLHNQWFPPLSAGQSSGSGSELLITVSTTPLGKLLSLRQPRLADALLELTPVCCCQMVLCVSGENHPHQQLADWESRSSQSGLFPCGGVFSLLDVAIGPVCWLWLG